AMYMLPAFLLHRGLKQVHEGFSLQHLRTPQAFPFSHIQNKESILNKKNRKTFPIQNAFKLRVLFAESYQHPAVYIDYLGSENTKY
ncbi:MAG: hypothetical protein ACRD5J_13925, partial [Nitrososphaeraceae archaeon]